jgi:hypothetical protein
VALVPEAVRVKADHRLADAFVVAMAMAFESPLLTGASELLRADVAWRWKNLRADEVGLALLSLALHHGRVLEAHELVGRGAGWPRTLR